LIVLFGGVGLVEVEVLFALSVFEDDFGRFPGRLAMKFS
jgi:hypothetical protein